MALERNGPRDFEELEQELFVDCLAMVRHAQASGIAIPGPILAALAQVSKRCRRGGELGYPKAPEERAFADLTFAHERLRQVIAPASPRTARLLEQALAEPSRFRFLGAIALVRQLVFLALISLASIIALSLSWSGPFTSESERVLVRGSSLMAAVVLGASFSALFQARWDLEARSFDMACRSAYWGKFAAGVACGALLVALWPTLSAGGGPALSLAEAAPALVGGMLPLGARGIVTFLHAVRARLPAQRSSARPLPGSDLTQHHTEARHPEGRE